MEPGRSIPHSQGLSKNPYLELNQLNFFKIHYHLRLGLPEGLLLNILEQLNFSNLAT